MTQRIVGMRCSAARLTSRRGYCSALAFACRQSFRWHPSPWQVLEGHQVADRWGVAAESLVRAI